MALLLQLLERNALDLEPRPTSLAGMAGDTLGVAATARDGWDQALGDWAQHFGDVDHQLGLEAGEFAAVVDGAGAFTPEELAGDAGELGLAADEGGAIVGDFDVLAGVAPPATSGGAPAVNAQRAALNLQLAQDRIEAELLRKSEPSAAQLAQGTVLEEQVPGREFGT